MIPLCFCQAWGELCLLWVRCRLVSGTQWPCPFWMGISNQQLRQCNWEKKSIWLGEGNWKNLQEQACSLVTKSHSKQNQNNGSGSSKWEGWRTTGREWEAVSALGSGCWAAICNILAPAGFSPSRRAMQRARAGDELFKWLPAVCFIMFCANVFSPITSVAGTWCHAAREACGCLFKILWKEGRTQVKAHSWFEQIQPCLVGLCRASGAAPARASLYPHQTELAFMASLLPL